MNPDNQTLLLWLEDELSNAEQVRIDAWAAEHPVWLTKRDAARHWRMQLPRFIPASEPLPHGDFFQSQLMRSIAPSAPAASAPAPSAGVFFWRKLMLPASVAAAMVLGFIGGMQWQTKPNRATTLVTYTPEEGVQAEFFETSPAEGTVIVLNGVNALPDAFVSTETTAVDPHHLNAVGDKKQDSAALVAP